MESFVREFVCKFAAARFHRERFVLTDALIHRFLWESGGQAGSRPGAPSLIERKMKNIMVFPGRLSRGEEIPPKWLKGKGQGS